MMVSVRTFCERLLTDDYKGFHRASYLKASLCDSVGVNDALFLILHGVLCKPHQVFRIKNKARWHHV